MKIKRNIILLFSLSLLILTSCSNGMVKKVTENGEIDPEKLPEADTTAVEASQVPSYDISNLPQSNTYVSKEELDSYYMRQLNTRCLADYNDIKTGLNSFHKEILLTKLISEEELFRIMAIIYIDEPLLFQMDSKYSYEKDNDGYITKVYPSYTMSADIYAQKYRDFTSTLRDLYSKADLEGNTSPSGFKATEYNTEMEIIKNYISKNISVRGASSDSNVVSNTTNMYTEARKFAALARYLGLDCAVKIGKPTSSHQISGLSYSGFNINELADISNYIQQNGNRYSIDFDFNQYCFWDVVKIEDNWYNVDFGLNSLMSDEYKNQITTDIYSKINEEIYDFGAVINTTDYIMSMSKLMYMNDQILGLSPACTSNDFVTAYRTGARVLKMISSQMTQYMAREVNNYKNNKYSYYFYQFEDEDNFQQFLDGFDAQVEAYNDMNSNTIVGYDLLFDRSTLTIIINNIEFKN